MNGVNSIILFFLFSSFFFTLYAIIRIQQRAPNKRESREVSFSEDFQKQLQVILSDSVQGRNNRTKNKDTFNLDEYDEAAASFDKRLYFKHVNASFTEMFGWTEEEVVGKDCRTFVTPDSARLINEREARKEKGEKLPSSFVIHFLCKKNQTITEKQVENTIIPIRLDGARIGYIATYDDPVKQKRLETDTERALKRPKRIVEEKSEVSLVLDADMTIKNAMGPVEKVLECSKEEVVGKSIFFFLSLTEDHIKLYKACAARGLEVPGLPRIHRNVAIRKGKKGKAVFHSMLIGQEGRDQKGLVLNLIKISSPPSTS